MTYSWRKKLLQEEHPLLAESYSNIASYYFEINDYENSLIFSEKVLEIRKDVSQTGTSINVEGRISQVFVPIDIKFLDFVYLNYLTVW